MSPLARAHLLGIRDSVLLVLALLAVYAVAMERDNRQRKADDCYPLTYSHVHRACVPVQH